MRFEDGEPGDAFLATEGSVWAVWKHLEGSELALAHKCGYDPSRKIVSLVLAGDPLNLPSSPKTDELDPPYAMEYADAMRFDTSLLTYLGKI